MLMMLLFGECYHGNQSNGQVFFFVKEFVTKYISTGQFTSHYL